MDVAKLLDRINYRKTICELSVPVLDELCHAFLCHVPYEALQLGREAKSLRLENIYNNIVVRKRGGSTYELNALFNWMLACIGFQVKMIKVSPYLEEEYDFADTCNMALLVTMKNGENRLVDVGCGERSFLSSINMDLLNADQMQLSGIYRLRRQSSVFILEKRRRELVKKGDDSKKVTGILKASTGDNTECESDWCPIFRFGTNEYDIAAFKGDFVSQQARPGQKNQHKVTMHYETGVKILTGNVFTKIDFVNFLTMKVVDVRTIERGQIDGILREEFGIFVSLD